MNKRKHTNRFAMVAFISVILLRGIILAGCDKVTQDEIELVTKIETRQPAEPQEADTAPVEETEKAEAEEPTEEAVEPEVTAETPAEETKLDMDESWLTFIANESDIFTLHDMREEYEHEGKKSEAVLEVLAKQRDKLVAEHERQSTIDDYLDFTAFDFKKIDGEKHLLHWYFIVTEDITLDWSLKVSLHVDQSHINWLPEERREAGFIKGVIYPETSQIAGWKKGQHKVLSLNMNLKEIPYNVVSHFYQYFPDKPAIYADPISHGWHVDLGEEQTD